MIVRMWEARAEPRTFGQLLAWVVEIAVPRVESSSLHSSSEIFSSPDYRIVVISRWHSTPEAFPEPPAHLVARAPHSWDFTPVDR